MTLKKIDALLLIAAAMSGMDAHPFAQTHNDGTGLTHLFPKREHKPIIKPRKKKTNSFTAEYHKGYAIVNGKRIEKH